MSATPPRAIKTYGRRGQTRLLHGNHGKSRAEKLWQEMLANSPQVRKVKPLDVVTLPDESPPPVVTRPKTYRRRAPPAVPAAASTYIDLVESDTNSDGDNASPAPAKPPFRYEGTASCEPGTPRAPIVLDSDTSDCDSDLAGSFIQEADRALEEHRQQRDQLGPIRLFEDLPGDSVSPLADLLDSPTSSPRISIGHDQALPPSAPRTPKEPPAELTEGLEGLHIQLEGAPKDPNSPSPDKTECDTNTSPTENLSSTSATVPNDSELVIDPTAKSPSKPALDEAVELDATPELTSIPSSVSEPWSDLAQSLPDLTHFVCRRAVRRDNLLALCSQTDPMSFDTFFGPDFLTQARKLDESTFSEVYLGPCRDFRGQIQSNAVVKIIPFGGGHKNPVNGQKQTTFRDVYQEMCVSWLLSYWPAYRHSATPSAGTTDLATHWNFIRVHHLGICSGLYPEPLLNEWDRWQGDHPVECQNIRPDYLPPEQLYAVFVLAHGGTSLEHYRFQSLAELQSLLQQLAYILALAEKELQFEHRDMHWGNILLAPSERTTLAYALTDAGAKSDPPVVHNVPTAGLEVHIIDYTFSRLNVPGQREQLFHVDITDPDMFTGQGDRQFDVYRQMAADSGGKWSDFCPKSNIHWFVYTIDKILTTKDGSQATPPYDVRNLLQPAYRDDFEKLYSHLAQYNSVAELVEGGHLGTLFILPETIPS